MSNRHASAVTPEQFATFGELLKYLRRRAGLTQRELSIAVGYSESQISRLEQNQRLPDAAYLQARLVPALNLETERAWAARLLELGGASRASATALPPSVAAPPNNLPLQLTSFVGREKMLAEVQQWVLGAASAPAARLVTLTGHGGCGKTRLALQAGAALLPHFSDGVWLVELAPHTDPEFLPGAVANALGLSSTAGRPDLASLIEHLRPLRTLLILDNCEHLIQVVAQLAEALLQACPQVSILATSREMLGIPGERPCLVLPLSTPAYRFALPPADLLGYEAVRLFIERAAFVAPDFVLDAGNALAVAQICHRLDGIPLAIELAAARLRILPVQQIAARLDDAFRLLTGGSRTALPRHQTLQALIDWSYALLTPHEAVLLRRLAVFNRGWTVEAAEAICAGDDGVTPTEVFELLTRLIDKSLVQVARSQPGQVARYRLLETIRQYASAKLAASGEADAVRQRHAAFFFNLAEMGAPKSPGAFTETGWINRMETEHGNLRAALSWSLATMGADRALSLGGSGDIRTGAWALNRLGWVARERGDYVVARARLEQSMTVYRELGDRLGVAWTGNTLGEVLLMQNHLAAAQACLDESLAIARELGEPSAIGWALNHLGHVASRRGELETARQLQQASLAAFESHGDYARGEAWALHDLGEIAVAAGDGLLARQLLIRSIEEANRVKDAAVIAWCLAGLAGAATLASEPGQAAWLWGASEAMRLGTAIREAPAGAPTHARLQIEARARIGDEVFASAWANGRSATQERIAELVSSFSAQF